MVKRACVDENGIRKGEWSQEEDNLLKVHIQERGHKNWRMLPKLAGLARCGKSCRLRWVNYLKPGVLKGGFTKDEVELITQLFQELGPKWSTMAKRLPGRTDNDIKNHWHAHIKKHMKTNSNKYSVVQDGDLRVEKKPHQDSSAAGSSTITSLDNNVILACDHDAADSWDSSSTQTDQLITSMDGTLYLSDHVVDMGNNQQYNCYYPTPSYISQDDVFQPQLLPKTEFSSLNSLSSGPEWMSMSTQNDDQLIITSMDGTVYLSDHSADMGNQQYCYPMPPYVSQDDLIFQHQVPKIELSNSTSFEWMSNGDHSVISSSDSQEQSLLLHLESLLISEPPVAAYNLLNDINNYQWRDFSSSFAAHQAQLYDGNSSYIYNLWYLN